MTKKSELQFFACDGGPHVVLPFSLRGEWSGAGMDYDPADESSDYARACAVRKAAALIAVGKGHALVLGGSPPVSAWGILPDRKTVCFYVFDEWKSEDLDALARKAVSEIPAGKMVDTRYQWALKAEPLALMFAGDIPGRAVYGEQKVPVKAGTYRILKGRYEGDRGKVSFFCLQPLP
jgi:hypothetical protein